MIFFKKKRFTGARLNPEDRRDVRLASFQAPTATPTKYFTDISILPVFNQLQLGSCVGQSHAQLKRTLDYYDIKQVFQLSPRYVYARSKALDNYLGQGTFPRIAASILKNEGIATEQTCFTNNTLSHEEFIKITPNLKDAEPYKIKGYALVEPTREALKQALVLNKVLTCTLSVGNWSKSPVKPISTQYNYGYHSIMLYGYEDVENNTKFYFRNSWGNWGDNGNGYFLFSEHEGKIYDVLAFTDIPNQILEEAKKS